MAIIYNKLFHIMEVNGMKKIDLRNQYKIHPATIQKLVNNKSVTIDTINQLCAILNCQPGDILEYVPDNQDNI